MKYDRGFVLPLMVVVIALLLVGGGYVYTQRASAPPKSSETTTNTGSGTASLDLASLSNGSDPLIRGVLEKAWAQPANFNGHYVIAEVNVTSACGQYYAIDKNTGKVYPMPAKDCLDDWNAIKGERFTLSSNQITVLNQNNKVETYSFDGNGFTQVSSKPVTP